MCWIIWKGAFTLLRAFFKVYTVRYAQIWWFSRNFPFELYVPIWNLSIFQNIIFCVVFQNIFCVVFQIIIFEFYSIWPLISVYWSVGRPICHSFLKGREVTLPCSYRWTFAIFCVVFPYLSFWSEVSECWETSRPRLWGYLPHNLRN